MRINLFFTLFTDIKHIGKCGQNLYKFDSSVLINLLFLTVVAPVSFPPSCSQAQRHCLKNFISSLVSKAKRKQSVWTQEVSHLSPRSRRSDTGWRRRWGGWRGRPCRCLWTSLQHLRSKGSRKTMNMTHK